MHRDYPHPIPPACCRHTANGTTRLEFRRKLNLESLAGPYRLAAWDLIVHVAKTEVKIVAKLEAGADGEALSPRALIEDVGKFAMDFDG